MTPTNDTLDNYIARDMSTVRGYLSRLDAATIATALKFQARNDMRGHLCEIGVHHGRLFFLLAHARREDERALAIDLFEDDAINATTAHRNRSEGFRSNMERLAVRLGPAEVFKTSSLEVTPDEILRRTGGPIRFFSVDGSHVFRFVAHDLSLAFATASAETIIAVDDFFSADWPDVSFAAYEAIRNSSQIVPVALTPSKLYLATASIAEALKDFIVKEAPVDSATRTDFLNHRIVNLRSRLLRRGYEVIRDRVSEAMGR